MTRKVSAFVTCALAMLASGAMAQDHRFELSGTIGWTYSDGVTGNSVKVPGIGTFNSIDPKNSINWGGRLGFMMTSNIEVGARYDRQGTNLQLGGTIYVDFSDIAITNYHGYFAYNFLDGGDTVRPYLLAGLGVTNYGSVNGKAGSTTREIGGNTQFSTTWAVGVKLVPSSRFALRLEAGWTPTYIKSDAAGYWCDPYWGCYMLSDAQYAKQFQLGGGLTFRF